MIADIRKNQAAIFHENLYDQCRVVDCEIVYPRQDIYAGKSTFNGPDKNENPGEKGYLRDGIHTNPSDDVVIADLLRDIGYDPVVP